MIGDKYKLRVAGDDEDGAFMLGSEGILIYMDDLRWRC